MELKPNCDSDRAWIWSVPADFADETPKPELLAVRFANAESKYSVRVQTVSFQIKILILILLKIPRCKIIQGCI
jgi:hypothetical protein